MGRVELCVRQGGTFQRLYAVKRLQPNIRNDEAARRMFLDEARLAGLVHHPNVVSVLDVGEDEEGPFLVMEYIEGITAKDLAREAAREGLPLPVEVVCELVLQVAKGLAHAHAQTSHDGTDLRIVHRDISPQNLLIDFEGIARVTDFGVARATGRSHETGAGVLKGKLGYMAPEVLQFEEIDLRTDLFSLGVVLYELLALRRLYGGKNDLERAKAILHAPPPDIGEVRDDVPPPVQALLSSLLAKRPENRPTDAGVVVDVLQQALRELRRAHPGDGLREHVESTFGELRATRRQKVQDALDALEAEPAPAVTTSRRRGIVAAALVGVCLLGVATALLWPRTAEPAETLAPEPPLADVAVEVVTRPAGATLALGETATIAPTTLFLPRSDAPLEIDIRLEGYVARRETVRPDRDQRLVVVLTPREEDEEPPHDVRIEPPPRMRTSARMRRGMRTTMRERAGTEMRAEGLHELWD